MPSRRSGAAARNGRRFASDGIKPGRCWRTAYREKMWRGQLICRRRGSARSLRAGSSGHTERPSRWGQSAAAWASLIAGMTLSEANAQAESCDTTHFAITASLPHAWRQGRGQGPKPACGCVQRSP
jgi:hypothetical protein